MAEFRMYRTYRWLKTEKNPVIDKVRTVVQDEGLYKNMTALHEISGVSVGALNGWFFGDTINPQHGTIMAVLTSLGYEEQFVKQKDIDVEKERKAGQAWLEKRAEEREKSAPARRKKKANGHAAPSMKRKYVGERREA
jgi:hypothetical protein